MFRSVFLELLPPDVGDLRAQIGVMLDNHQNLLMTDILVKRRGAFLIDRFVDRPWHLTEAYRLNDLGQILGAGHNSVTGQVIPILLTPKSFSAPH
jgi:hypothetical protein